MARALLVLVFLMLTIVVPFAIWGDDLEILLSQDALRAELQDNAGIAWLIAIGLLAVDIVLPIPSSVIIGALGIVYGTVLGGVIASLGLIASGLLGYGICRVLGRPVAIRMAGAEELASGDRLFARHGGWMVALSRLIPVLAEVIALSAGLAAMPARTFVIAITCGAIPVGFLYAAVGAIGAERPFLVIAICLGLSGVLWLVAATVFGLSGRPLGPRSSDRTDP